MTDKNISVAIVGLGQIAAGYDFVPSNTPRSHIGAIMATSGLRVAAIVDPDGGRHVAVRERWPELPAAADDAATLSDLTSGVADIIVLCTPPQERRVCIEQALALRPKLLFVEKPLAVSLEEGRRAIAAADAAQTAIRINFHRRLDPGHRRARAAMTGRPIAVSMRYGKGLSNYGSHLVDLLLDWCGPITAAAALGSAIAGDDPTIGFRLRFSDGLEATAIGIDDTTYDNFDIDFFFRDGRIELAAGGAERRVWRSRQNLYYNGYAHLAIEEEASEISPVSGLPEFYAAARDHLLRGVPLPGCDGADALAGLGVIEAIKCSAANHGSWQTVATASSLTRHLGRTA